MRYIVLVFFIIMSNDLFTQENLLPSVEKLDEAVLLEKKNNVQINDASEITIKDYKIISFARDTTFLDTTLTIQKEYKYNYLRRDDFELMPFANIGQPYNKLGVNFEPKTFYPSLGAKAKHNNYFEIQDIDYYNVATPMTDLFFKTTFEEGQLLDALLTFNTSRRLNFSLAYKGFRSLGKYQFNLARSGNFRATTNYEAKNKRYTLRAHIAAQDIETEENGGLSNGEEQFNSADEDFRDRIKVDVLFGDAQNKILGKRYFLDHQYKLVRKQKDSSRVEKTSLGIGHQFNYETKYYNFSQDTQDNYFGDAFLSAISDRASLKTTYNQLSADFYNSTLGALQGNISVYSYVYFFNSKLITAESLEIQNQLKGQEIAIGANYRKQIGRFLTKANAKYNVSGDLAGNSIDASVKYKLNSKNAVKFVFHSSSKMPNFNFLLYQSEYENYNWQNTATFEKENVNSFQFDLNSKIWGDLSVKYATIDNYSFFTSDPSQEINEASEQAFLKPFQESGSVNHLKVKYNKEIKVWRFTLDNTLMYQNITQDNTVLNVPQFVTRNTLYFSSNVFKKAMYLQTGVTFKYFTMYNADAYNPVLGEFYVQNAEQVGGYPIFDFFINARVQQTRIYLKAEHFNSGFGATNDFYAAPNYPYRDFIVRFGLVWNFFS